MKGCYTTEPTHRPKSRQRHLEWCPSRLVAWGASIGGATARVVATILARQPHSEQGYRACLRLLSLSRRYDPTRLDAARARASARALAWGAVSYRAVKSILATSLDHFPLEAEPRTLQLPATHEHVRGEANGRNARGSQFLDHERRGARPALTSCPLPTSVGCYTIGVVVC